MAISLFMSDSPGQTMEIAEDLAKAFRGGEVVALWGELGAGKTVFAKGIARGLGVADTVASPTFTIMQVYEGRLRLYHCDMYRIGGEEELSETGFFDALADLLGVMVIEWPSRIRGILPKELIEVELEVVSEGERRITVRCDELPDS